MGVSSTCSCRAAAHQTRQSHAKRSGAGDVSMTFGRLPFRDKHGRGKRQRCVRDIPEASMNTKLRRAARDAESLAPWQCGTRVRYHARGVKRCTLPLVVKQHHRLGILSHFALVSQRRECAEHLQGTTRTSAVPYKHMSEPGSVLEFGRLRPLHRLPRHLEASGVAATKCRCPHPVCHLGIFCNEPRSLQSL